MKEFALGKLKYLIRYPKDFSENEKFPVILFFHGSGTRSQDFEKLRNNPLFPIIEKHEKFPFVVIAPLCTENTWFDLWEHIRQLVQEIPGMPFTDENRIYIMGLSMGGYAAWQLGMSMPEYFAAMIPICGGGMYWNAGRLVNVPVWAFHGGKDRTVLPEESEKMVNKINALGGSAKLTIYPDNFHDAWRDTYANYEVFEWLLTHEKKLEKDIEDQYTDSAKYG